MKVNDQQWRRMAKVLRITGFVCCIVFFTADWVLCAYLQDNRPSSPQPDSRMTVALQFTKPKRYGTAQDESRLQLLFELFFPSFGLIAVGEMIRIYKLKGYSSVPTRPKQPWDIGGGPTAL